MERVRGLLRRRLEKRGGALLALALLVPVAHAGDCPHTPAVPPAAWELPGIGAHLASRWEACLRDAPYLAYFGSVRLAEGNAEEAAALLERAMLLAPDLAGARLDYAEALAALGDREAARAWLNDVLASDQPPDLVADRIRLRLDRLADSRWRRSARFVLKGGYDSNPMLAPRLSSLTLTLPSGWVTLPVDTGSTKGSSVAQGEVQLAAQRLPTSADGGTLTVLAEARWRRPFSAIDARYSEFSGGAIWEQPLGSAAAAPLGTPDRRWGLLGGVTGNLVTLGGETIYRGLRGLAGGTAPWPCQPRALLDMERRDYPTSTSLNGDYVGMAASATCANDAGQTLALGVRFGKDRPDGFRAGGELRRAEIRVGGAMPFAGGRLEGDVTGTRLTDADAYSPVLAEGARRWINRVALRAEYARPLMLGWEAVASIERVDQNSNLELFALSGTTVLFGVRTTLGW
jgi:hypothetical protein